jgi:hypothetical protein
MNRDAETARRELTDVEAEIARLNRELGLDLEVPLPAHVETDPARLAIHEQLAELYRRAAKLSKQYAELYRRGEV